MTFPDRTKAGFPEEELPEILPYSVKYYVTYDAEALYVAAGIVEASLYTRCDNISEIWGPDSLEVDISVDAYNEIPDDETDAPESDCGAVVGFGAVSVAMAMAAAVALRKKD